MRPEVSKPARYVAWFCLAAFTAVLWPVYSWFSDIEPRVLGMPFSLTYDHRIINGIGAEWFLVTLREHIENPLSLIA